MRVATNRAWIALSLSAGLTGCVVPGVGGAGPGGANDKAQLGRCSIANNSGRPLSGEELKDPLANTLRAFGSCDLSLTEVFDALRIHDVDEGRCAPEGTDGTEGTAPAMSAPGAGMATRFVAEEPQVTGNATTPPPTGTSFRVVTSRECNGRAAKGLLFSYFMQQPPPAPEVEEGQEPADAPRAALPSRFEAIAFDETQGVFNYYQGGPTGLAFFGNSKDMVGDSAPFCAQCHNGGGLVMKELDTPWLNWEGHMNTPGAETLMAADERLGSKRTGSEMESLVKAANQDWNGKRLAHLKAQFDAAETEEARKAAARALLEPLFCTVEFNLDNGAIFESPVDGAVGEGRDDMTEIPVDLFLDPQLKLFGSVTVRPEAYQALLAEVGSRLDRSELICNAENQLVFDEESRANQQRGITEDNTQLRDPEGRLARDTIFDFVFPERSHIDNDYVKKLKSAGIVDDELVKDVLMVDFTRPIFSDDRCGLLEHVPAIEASELNPEGIRAKLIAEIEPLSNENSPLSNENSPVAERNLPVEELLANLKQRDVDHEAKVSAFLDACNGELDPETRQASDEHKDAFLRDAYKFATAMRLRARSAPVIEEASVMPQDNLLCQAEEDPRFLESRLSPSTCGLTDRFEPVTIDPPPAPEPTPTGGEEPASGEEEPSTPTCDPCVAHENEQLTRGCHPVVETVCGADENDPNGDHVCCDTEGGSWDGVCVQAATSAGACPAEE